MKLKDYPCPQGPAYEDLPPEAEVLAALEALDIRFPDVFYDSEMYARYARYEYDGEAVVIMPLDHALEAEVYGAEITPGTAFHELRLQEPRSGKPEDVLNLPLPDMTAGRFPVIFAAGKELLKQGYRVGLGLAGPYTFYGGLIPLKRMMIASRRAPEVLLSLLERMVDIHMAIITEAERRGFSIVSLGDPTGSLSVLGPRGFRQTLERYVLPLVNRILDETGVRILLCPKYRLGFESLGILAKEVHNFDEPIGFYDAIGRTFDEARIFGDRCPNETRPTKRIVTYRLAEIGADDGAKDAIEGVDPTESV